MNPAEIYTKLFASLADDAYRETLKSGILMRSGGLVQFDMDVKTVKMRTLETTGNLNYNRNDGYADGDVLQDWSTYVVENERGVRLKLDILDGAEALGLHIAEVADSYLRHKDVPEVDAVAFQKIAAQAGHVETADIVVGTTDAIAAMEAGLSQMRKDEISVGVPKVMFASSDFLAAYRLQKKDQLSFGVGDKDVNLISDRYNEVPLIEVPSARFADTVTLLNTGAGGYTIPSGAHQINFMIVALDAAFVFNAYKRIRYIPFEANQHSDHNLILSRHFYDAFVLSKKENGIYVHKAATANA